MSVVHIIGARPNIPKFKPIWDAIGESGEAQEWINTGQHYSPELFQDNANALKLPDPIINLNIKSSTSVDFIGMGIPAIADTIKKLKAKTVIVYGDVNSTVAAALGAKYQNLQLIHIEAGLRSFDRSMPEELNRIIVDSISDEYFTTMPSATQNLLIENKMQSSVHECGNTMIDTLQNHLDSEISVSDALKSLIGHREFILLTLHRGSNVDGIKYLERIMCEVEILAKDIPIVFPAHPRVRKNLKSTKNIQLVPPLNYNDFVNLMLHAHILITDSGGVQEETSYLGVPCFTLRKNTERPETISLGTNALIELKDLSNVLHFPMKRRKIELAGWDGKAGPRIAEKIIEMKDDL